MLKNKGMLLSVGTFTQFIYSIILMTFNQVNTRVHTLFVINENLAFGFTSVKDNLLSAEEEHYQ